MERSGNFYKAIQLGYILISILIGCMAYNSLYEWQEIEALELGNKKIDELRKEINNINIQMILKSATALIRWHRGQKGSGTAAKEGATQQKSPQRRRNSPYPTTQLEAIRRITTISCRCYPKSFRKTSA